MSFQSSPLAFILFLSAACLRAQNPYLDFKHAIIGYNISSVEIEHADWTTANEKLISNYSKTVLEALHPTIAVRWRTKRLNFQEAELTRWSSKRTDLDMDGQYISHSYVITSGNQVTTTDIQARYEFILTFNRKKECRWIPAIGFGAKPYYNSTNVKIDNSPTYSVFSQTFGVEGQIVPRLTYYTRKRMFVDINIPLSLFYQNFIYQKTTHPEVPIQYRDFGYFIGGILPAVIGLRLGLGIKI